MNRVKTLLLSGLAATMVMGASTAQAVDPINVVVVSEDAPKTTIPRGNRIFNRVISAMQEELNTRGFNIYDETAVGMGHTAPGRVRRRDTELLDIARSITRPPLDVIVIFQIYASVRKSTYSDIKRPYVRIPGRMLNVHSGQFIGSFEVGGFQLPPLPRNCGRECLLEAVGNESRVIGRNLASALADKLRGFVRGGPAYKGGSGVVGGGGGVVSGGKGGALPIRAGCDNLPRDFFMVFDGFSQTEMTQIERGISSFSCYENHRLARASATSIEYNYRSQSNVARINRNIRLMLQVMGLTAQINFIGNKFNVVKVATR